MKLENSQAKISLFCTDMWHSEVFDTVEVAPGFTEEEDLEASKISVVNVQVYE